MGVYDESIKSFRKRGLFALAGVADVIAVLNINGINAVIFLEIKTPTGKQSKAQKAFERGIKRQLGYYYVVRSIEETITAIKGVKDELVRYVKRNEE